MAKSPRFVNLILHIIGFLLCILPPLCATLSYFPVWFERGADYAISGGSALLCALCILPLAKHIARLLRSSASYAIWLVMFLAFLALSKIAEEMTVISFVGFAGNLLGSVCFIAARRYKNERK